MKNFIANLPLLFTLPFQLMVKLLNKICMLGIAASSFLHVTLNTDVGKQIKLLEAEYRKAQIIQKQLATQQATATQQSKVTPNPKLKNIMGIEGMDDTGRNYPKV